ncbi:MAG: hypothetical protein Q7N50_15115 [Armatimonadota bacterium]|nr:hypothetical protein [Armatimonadota bacterium]
MAQCDYWWFAGNVEWCDLKGDSCKCGGWQDSCALKGHCTVFQNMEEELPVEAQSRQRSSKFPRHVAHQEPS